MDLLSVQKNPHVICFGDKTQLVNLFKKISNYESSFNKLKIEEVQTNFYNFKIDTKYYELDLVLELVQFDHNISRLNTILSNLTLLNEIQSIFILIDDKNFKYLSKIESLIDKLDELNKENSCLNILILNGDFQVAGEIENFLSKRDNFVKIKLDDEEKNVLDDDEDQFSDFDELINTILVHSWEGISLKSDKKAVKRLDKFKTDKKLDLVDEDFDDKNLNFEDLMMNLKDIREKSMNLDFEERKKYAENITLNFWKSIEGDPEEVKEISDEK